MTNGSELANRVLWFDGSSSYSISTLMDGLYDCAQQGLPMFATEPSDEISLFNTMVPKSEAIQVKCESDTLEEVTWTDDVLAIQPESVIAEKLAAFLSTAPSTLHEDYIERTQTELQWFLNNDHSSLLSGCIHVVNRLTETNSVWGVGRGSTVSSFILYLIGIHDIDSVKYNIPFNELTGE